MRIDIVVSEFGKPQDKKPRPNTKPAGTQPNKMNKSHGKSQLKFDFKYHSPLVKYYVSLLKHVSIHFFNIKFMKVSGYTNCGPGLLSHILWFQ